MLMRLQFSLPSEIKCLAMLRLRVSLWQCEVERCLNGGVPVNKSIDSKAGQ